MTATGIDAVLQERGKRYGDFVGHASVSQTLKGIIKYKMGHKWDLLNADQKESLEMICHKLGRIVNGDPNYGDSWRDIAGYAQLVADRLEGVPRVGEVSPPSPMGICHGDVHLSQSVTLEGGSTLTASPAEKPWYPDDSGEWVEVPNGCRKNPIPDSDKIEYMTLGERIREKWATEITSPMLLSWDFEPDQLARVVAYKVIK